MKIICTRDNLNKGLIIGGRLSIQNINLPVLNNVLLETRQGGLRIATTNLEMGVDILIRGKILSEGNITVPASLISNYVNSLQSEKIKLIVQNNELSITDDLDQAKIKGLPSTDFPFQYEIIEKIKKGKVFQISENELRKGIISVYFAAAVDELRPEISGVLFNFDGGDLILAATDSYRLAEKKVKSLTNNENDSSKFKVIVPIRAVQELVHILGESDDLVNMYFAEGQVLFQVREVNFTARLVEGQYPDYKQIIPQRLLTSCLIPARDFSQVIKRASFFAAKETSDVKIKIKPNENEILISAQNVTAGSAEAHLAAEIKGEPQEVVYNYRYLLDGIANLNSNQAVFKTNGPDEAGIIHPGGEDNSFLYLIMPIKG